MVWSCEGLIRSETTKGATVELGLFVEVWVMVLIGFCDLVGIVAWTEMNLRV